MKIGNKELTRESLSKRIGSASQIGGTRHYELNDGSARGVRAIDFHTGSLCFTVLPDRGLDISQARFRGTNLVYLTPNGEVNPGFYDARGSEWLRNFFAGLLTTCGLTHIGAPGRDGEEELGLHGRYTNTPARRICDLSSWQGDDYHLEVSGIIEESCLFGPKLRLERRICSQIGRKSLTIRDRVQNFGFTESPFTILYHINPGFPLLDNTAYLVISAASVKAYDEHSENSIKQHKRFSVPQLGFQEQNYLHTMNGDRDAFGYAALINPELCGGLGLYLKYKIDTLPYLSEWKMMGEGEYVVGIEPCNTPCLNRAVLKERKQLPYLKPGEIKENNLEIGVLEGSEEISVFERKVKNILG